MPRCAQACGAGQRVHGGACCPHPDILLPDLSSFYHNLSVILCLVVRRLVEQINESMEEHAALIQASQPSTPMGTPSKPPAAPKLGLGRCVLRVYMLLSFMCPAVLQHTRHAKYSSRFACRLQSWPPQVYAAAWIPCCLFRALLSCPVLPTKYNVSNAMLHKPGLGRIFWLCNAMLRNAFVFRNDMICHVAQG
eukprot:1141776-Pelagomonas_calceolata.AAC.6